jgi:DNA-binding FrmR family transcriptional regulator
MWEDRESIDRCGRFFHVGRIDLLRLIASARGAMNSLMAEMIESHIRDHAFRGARATSEEGSAAGDLVDIIRSYLK